MISEVSSYAGNANSKFAFPNDEYISQQWYLENTYAYGAWNEMTKARRCSEVSVAVIDTGLKMNHEDLQEGIDTVQSVDITKKPYEMLSNQEIPYINGHGTRVASIINARVNNGIGMAGIAGISADNGFKCNIVGIKAARSYEWEPETDRFELADEIKAMEYAMQCGVDVINLSLNGADYHQEFQNVINKAVNDYGVLVVAAAGNNASSELTYPVETILKTTATDILDTGVDEKSGSGLVNINKAVQLAKYTTYQNVTSSITVNQDDGYVKKSIYVRLLRRNRL